MMPQSVNGKLDPGSLSVNLDSVQQNGIQPRRLTGCAEFPIVFSPQNSSADFDSFLNWVRSERSSLRKKVVEAGAVLFRGFTIETPHQFEEVVRALEGAPMPYEGGTADRQRVAGEVHTSTSMPARFKLPLHHEMAYRERTPRRIFFFCQKASPTGGQTILGDGATIGAEVRRQLPGVFEGKTVRLERRLLNGERKRWIPLRVSKAFRMTTWQRVFGTSDRREVERSLRDQGYTFQWTAAGNLNFWTDLSPFITHPETGKEIWFRPLHYFDFSPRVYGKLIYRAVKWAYRLARKDPPILRWSTGEPIDRPALDQIHQILSEHEVQFDWQEGDLLYLDNRRIAHGRNPFQGSRSILVLMTGDPKYDP